MENFAGYAWQQFAIGNDAKVNAIVGLALDIAATVQDWQGAGSKKSKAECVASLKTALILAKVPDTSRDRFAATVEGLVTRLAADLRAPLDAVRAAMVAADAPMTAEAAVERIRADLSAIGVENLGFLETYARKGKPGIAALAAEFKAKAEARAALANMSEAEAAEAAKAEADAAEAAKADASPRAKAAKQVAAILAAFAKHSDNMSDEELRAIAAAVGEVTAKRAALATAARLANEKAEAAEAKGKADIEASNARVEKAAGKAA